jgi:hypothetical protein
MANITHWPGSPRLTRSNGQVRYLSMDRRSLARALVCVALGVWLTACGANRGAGPNYSTTPCVDNCGNDTQCQARCTDIGGPSGTPPLGVYHTK